MKKGLGNFAKGFFAPFWGLGYMLRHPGTLKFALPPVPIVLGLMIVMVMMVFDHSGSVMAWMWDAPAGDAWYVTYLLVPLWHFLKFVLMLVLFVLGSVLITLLSLPLAGPFMEMLSEKVEAIETGFEAPFKLSLAMRNMVISLMHVLLFASMGLTVTLTGFAMGFIPILGQVAALTVSFTAVPMMLAFTPMDYPMTLRLWPFADKMRFVWRNKALFYGFALATYLFLYIPILNLILLPACVVAATRFIIEQESDGRLTQRDRRKELLVRLDEKKAQKVARKAARKEARKAAKEARKAAKDPAADLLSDLDTEQVAGAAEAIEAVETPEAVEETATV